MTERTRFLGLVFDQLDIDGAVARIRQRPASQAFGYVVTPNVDHVVRLHHDGLNDELGEAYGHAELNLCDSRVMALLARLQRVHLMVAPGSDVTARLLQAEAGSDVAMVVIGGDGETLPRLTRRFGLTNVVQHIPPMGLLENEAAQAAAVAFLMAHPARYIFFAVGSPQQELLALRALRHGGIAGLGLCVGASLDYLTGRSRRAPFLFRFLALEWMYRLLCEPRRLWHRYLVRSPGIFRLLRRWHD